MAFIPEAVRESSLSRKLCRHLKRTKQGKVRDVYQLGGGKLLLVATNRISSNDFVLGGFIQGKGSVLTATTAFWFMGPLAQFPNHMVAVGAAIDAFLPGELRNDPELQMCAMVVTEEDVALVEAIVRGYMLGTAWKDYQKDGGKVCGIQFEAGLREGDKLPEPVFTPSNKASEDHDVNIPVVDVRAQFPWMEQFVLAIYAAGNKHMEGTDFIVLDTKFECREGMLLDEALTCDSSRYTRKSDYASRAPGTAPPSYDKQVIRDYLATIKTPFGIPFAQMKPKNPDHRAFASSVVLPGEVTEPTMERYHDVFMAVAGKTMEQFFLGLGVAV